MLVSILAIFYPNLDHRDQMSAKIIFRKKEYEIRPGTTILTALKRLNIRPEAVIPTKNGELILEDDIIEEGDVIKLVGVISGG